MVGNGRNKNLWPMLVMWWLFIKYLIENQTEVYNVYNYIDKPDLSMTELVNHVGDVFKEKYSIY